MAVSWDAAAERTKRHYIRKATQVVSTALQEISPQNAHELLDAIKNTGKESDGMDSTLLEAIIECYENADHWSSQRQMLSIIADKVSLETLEKWLPDMNRYRFKIARDHITSHGRGAPVPLQKQTRSKVMLS